MSKFKRKSSFPKVYDKPWHDPEYDALRPNKKRGPSPTEEERFLNSCILAKKMKEQFGWRSWMDDFVDERGDNKPYQKGILV